MPYRVSLMGSRGAISAGASLHTVRIMPTHIQVKDKGLARWGNPEWGTLSQSSRC